MMDIVVHHVYYILYTEFDIEIPIYYFLIIICL